MTRSVAPDGDGAGVRRGRCPSRILTSVLLPAPLAPMSACTSPGAHGQRGVAQRRDGAVALGDAACVEQQVGHVMVPGWCRGVPGCPAPLADCAVGLGLLARALAGEELVLGVRRPARDRAGRGPGRVERSGRSAGGQLRLALVADVVPDLGGQQRQLLGSARSPLRICSASVTPAPPTEPGLVTAAPTRPG